MAIKTLEPYKRLTCYPNKIQMDTPKYPHPCKYQKEVFLLVKGMYFFFMDKHSPSNIPLHFMPEMDI